MTSPVRVTGDLGDPRRRPGDAIVVLRHRAEPAPTPAPAPPCAACLETRAELRRIEAILADLLAEVRHLRATPAEPGHRPARLITARPYLEGSPPCPTPTPPFAP